jgi:hypothetical protein
MSAPAQIAVAGAGGWIANNLLFGTASGQLLGDGAFGHFMLAGNPIVNVDAAWRAVPAARWS